MKPTLSIVIPVKGQRQYTCTCLADITSTTHVPYEVVIYDSPSNERFDPSLHNDMPLTVLYGQDPKVGMYELLNRAVECAQGDYLAIINNDILLGQRVFDNCIAAMQQFNLQSVYPRVFTNPGPVDWLDWYSIANKLGSSPLTIAGPPEWRGWFIVVTRGAWEAVGGFDEHYKLNYGDNDFFEKLKRIGVISRQVENAAVHHFQGQTPRPDWYTPEVGDAETTYFKQKWGFEVHEQGDRWPKR
jgi:GT2 family glycosyltransferase